MFVAAALLAVGLFALGLAIQNQAKFGLDTVHRQLASEGIVFTPVSGLKPAQKKVPCLVANAGKPLTTGTQAECYADFQIGIDLTTIAGGKTYYQVHSAAYLLQVKTAAAVKANPNAPATVALVAQSSQMSQMANALEAGEASRGLLLTAYGFSIIAERSAEAATVCFVIAGLLLLAGGGACALSSRRRHSSTPSSVATEWRSATTSTSMTPAELVVAASAV